MEQYGYPIQDITATSKATFYLHGERYFRTGDTGRLDARGALYLGGRQKELIKVTLPHILTS